VPECQPTHRMEHRNLPKPESDHASTCGRHARALLEHYALLGAPSGFWSRHNQSYNQNCDMYFALNPDEDIASNFADEEDLDAHSDSDDSGDDSSMYQDSHNLSTGRVAVAAAVNERHLFESASRPCPVHESPMTQKRNSSSESVDSDCTFMNSQPSSAFSGVLAADDTSMVSMSDDAYQFGTECTDDGDLCLGTQPCCDPEVDLAAWQTVGLRLSRVLNSFPDSDKDTNLPKNSVWDQCSSMDSFTTPSGTNSGQLSAKAGRQVQKRSSLYGCPRDEPMNFLRWQEVAKRIGEVLAFCAESESDCDTVFHLLESRGSL